MLLPTHTPSATLSISNSCIMHENSWWAFIMLSASGCIYGWFTVDQANAAVWLPLLHINYQQPRVLKSAASAGWEEGSLRGLGSVRPAEAVVPAAGTLHSAAGGRWWVRSVSLLQRLGCAYKAIHRGGEEEKWKLCCHLWGWGAKDGASQVVGFCLYIWLG